MSGNPMTKQRMWRTLPWLVVAACAAISYQMMLPPPPVQSGSATEFSAGRALEHVRTIATEPRPMGSPANARVRNYIRDTLTELGVEVHTQEQVAPDYFGSGESITVANVIGRIPGSANTGAITLVAHYDTVPTTPGANDNSVAVATLLETARALLAGSPLDNDVLLLFTDGEEPAPRYGASAFVADSPVFGEIALVVNLEAIGGSGASLLVETSGPEAWLIGELARADSRPAAFSFLTETARLLGNIGTDFDEFRNAGTTGMHFAYLHGSPIYHTAADNIDAVGFGSLQHHGNHALEVARQFGFHDFTEPPSSQGAVFFSLGSSTVRYPTALAIPLMLAALAGLWSGLVRSARHGGVAAAGRGLASATVSTLGAAILGAIVWMLIVAIRPTLGQVEGYFYFACIVAGAGGGMIWLGSRMRPLPPRRYAPIVMWLALTVLTAFLGVGFSYLFVWPALAGAIALWWAVDGEAQSTIRFAIVCAPALVLTIPAIDVFLQFAFPRPGNADSSMPVIALVPLFLALLVAGFLRAFWPTNVAHDRAP